MKEENLYRIFADECGERLIYIEEGLEKLKENPSCRDTMNDIFRNFHTIKGIANFIKLEIVSKMIGKTEKLIERHWEREIKATDHFIALVVKSAEILKSLSLEVDAINEKEFLRNVRSHYVYLSFIEEELDLKGKILESVSDGVITINEEKKIISCNKSAESICGYKKEEIIDMDCHKLFNFGDNDKDCIKEWSVKKNREELLEIEIKHKYGKDTMVKISFYPIKDEFDDLIGAMIIFKKASGKNEGFENSFIYKTRVMEKINEMIDFASKVDSTILITGETGTGKELVAKLIHERGTRSKNQMIKINCAAIPENLLESELFGYDRGAFTGAVSSKKGYFEMANKGIIFLDEIAEINMTLQAKLLRVIQEGEFFKVGGKQPVKVDVKIIAATNKNLREEVKKGRFREDLFYRLNVFNIEIPPLRERREEIPYLIEVFINKYNHKMQKNIKNISKEALDKLMEYGFPGNVRELENVMEYCFIRLDAGTIETDDLPKNMATALETIDYNDVEEIMTLDDMEKKYVTSVYKKFENNKLRTAKALGIDVRRLRRMLVNWSTPQ